MRVLQLGPFPPPHGGVQTNLVAIRDYLREHGHSCAVINITSHRKRDADQVYYPKTALGLVWKLFSRPCDVVHLHVGGKIPLRVIALAFIAAAVPWARSVLTLHSGGYPSSKEAQRLTSRSLLAFVLRRFDALIGVNREMTEMFERLGVPKSQIRLISPHSVSRARMADRLTEPLVSFFRNHERVLVAVCGLEPEYDLPRQIEALGPVLEKFPRTGLAILGSGSQEIELHEQISATGYSDHILLCGAVPHEVTLRALLEGDALLRTTLYDGDSISIREALYLGTPVIATDNCMRPEGVRLVPIGDTEALANAIVHVLQNGVAARAQPEPDERNLAEVVELYSEIRDTGREKGIPLTPEKYSPDLSSSRAARECNSQQTP